LENIPSTFLTLNASYGSGWYKTPNNQNLRLKNSHFEYDVTIGLGNDKDLIVRNVFYYGNLT
jgi:hypothetical protein